MFDEVGSEEWFGRKTDSYVLYRAYRQYQYYWISDMKRSLKDCSSKLERKK